MTNQTSEPDEARQVSVTKKQLAEKFKKAFAEGLGGAVANKKGDAFTVDVPPTTVTVGGPGISTSTTIDPDPVTVSVSSDPP